MSDEVALRMRTRRAAVGEAEEVEPVLGQWEFFAALPFSEADTESVGGLQDVGRRASRCEGVGEARGRRVGDFLAREVVRLHERGTQGRDVPFETDVIDDVQVNAYLIANPRT